MVDGDVDIVFRAPVLCELIEPFIVFRNEMAPLHNGKRLGVGKGSGDEWCAQGRRRSSSKGKTGLLQETASRDAQGFARAHLDSSCGCLQLEKAHPDEGSV